MSTLAHQELPLKYTERGQDALVIGLRLSGWVATTLMATLGVATLFFVILGSFTLSGTMLQLDNLASRYLEAEPARQVQFNQIVCSVLSLAFLLITFFRRASLRAAFDVTGAKDG